MDKNKGTMDWTRLVATAYDQAGIVEKTCRISPRDDGHGERWTVRANDGSFEMILASDRTIETIFLFPGREARLPLGLQHHFSQRDVAALLGGLGLVAVAGAEDLSHAALADHVQNTVGT